MKKIWITLALTSALAGGASAVINFNITNPIVSVTRSTMTQSVTFSGTIMALNADVTAYEFSTPSGWSAVPTSDFITYLSQTTTSAYTGTIATVIIPGGAAAGTYLSPSTFLSVTDAIGLADSEFYSITIGNQPVPEPASLAALSVGAVALLRRRRKA